MKTLNELALDLSEGRTSSRKLVDQALAAIDDPAGEGDRTFLLVDRAGAIATAELMDDLRARGKEPTPWAGIPFSSKDLFDEAGEVTTAGSKVLANHPAASRDARCISRLKAAGFVRMGRTNMTEFAYSGVGLNPHYGTPKSVWDREAGRIPGGSSSGAAVSVVDGMAALGIGTDTGGSCRIPAAFNRVVGYKPSTGRVPKNGVFPLSETLDAPGPFALTVECCATADALMAEDWSGEIAETPLSSLRLGALKTMVCDDLDEHVGSALEAALGALSAAGASVVDVPFAPIAQLPEINAKGGIAAAEAFSVHHALMATNGDEYDQRVRTRVGSGSVITAQEIIEVHQRRGEMIEQAHAAMAGVDAWVMPTCPNAPFKIADVDDDENYGPLNLKCLRNTFVGNFLHTCAISLPIGQPDGAPVGLMLMMPAGNDARLFSIAAAVEAQVGIRNV
ncbi:MAG: amidase [Rhodobacteraceae bacterium]|nr:amidase [Paracoccaceae bacterium]